MAPAQFPPADVEIVATFKLSNINRKRLEALLHKFFGSARLDLELKDRFGGQVEPQEWFLVPLKAIEEAIERLKAGSIGNYQYDAATAQIVKRGENDTRPTERVPPRPIA